MTGPVSATRLAWDSCGAPRHPQAVDQPDRCLVCGADHPRTARPKDVLGANFDLLTATRPDGTRVCEPCAWALAGKPPNTLRMWSLAVTASTVLPPPSPALKKPPPAAYANDGRLHLCNRADQSVLLRLLTAPPDDSWAVAVAVSGQKHLLPYTPVNPPRAARVVVRFEAADVVTTPTQISALVGAVARLRQTGHPSTAIHDDALAIGTVTAASLAAWQRWAPLTSPHARSPLLGLAIHLTTKESLDALADQFG